MAGRKRGRPSKKRRVGKKQRFKVKIPIKPRTRRIFDLGTTGRLRYSFRSSSSSQENAAVNVVEDKLSQVPVVLLTRCIVTEDLLKKLYHSGDNMVSSDTMDSVSGNNQKVNVRKCRTKQVSGASKFIKSFKITAQLSSDATNSARKIDVISLPVETVSITDEKPKKPKTVSVSKEATPKRLSWNMRQIYSANILENLLRITSSDSIFTNASLDSDSASFTITSPKRKYSLCRTSSIDSLNTIDSQQPWSPRKNAEFTAQKCHVTKRSADSLEDFDCQTGGRGVLVRSDSSGYHSEHKLSDNSPVSSNVSSPKRRVSEDYYHDITVTVRSSNPEGDSGQAQNQCGIRQATVVKKRVHEFKTPKLPLYRRPPTRIENCGINSNVQANIVKSIPPPRTIAPTREVVLDDIDAISLFAESCCLDLDGENRQSPNKNSFSEPIDETPERLPNTNVINNRAVINSPSRFIQKPVLKSPQKHKSSPKPATPSTTFNKPDSPVVKANEPGTSLAELSPPKLPIAPAIPVVTQQFNIVEVDTSKVNDWIASTPTTPQTQGNIRRVLACLKRMCRFHWNSRNCTRKICHYYHNLPKDFQNTLRESNEEQFRAFLNEIVKMKYLFKETFGMILMYYKEKDMADDLIYLIQNVLTMEFDKTPFVRDIIFALKDMGYSFVEAVDEILLTHGRRTQSLLDILLMIIVDEDDCLENNWHFIDKLTKFRKNKLDHGVVMEILEKCCNKEEPNREFCEKIYKDLIIKSHIELDKIRRELVIKYVNLLYHFDFVQYAEHLKQNNRISEHELAVNRTNLPVNKTILPEEQQQEQQKHTADCKNPSDVPCIESATSTSSLSARHSDEVDQQDGAADGSAEASSTSSSSSSSDASSSEVENPLDFSADCVEAGDDVQEDVREEVEEVVEEEEAEREAKEEQELQGPPRSFPNDLSLQTNQSYTNYDLDTYLSYVNRDIYTAANVFKADEPATGASNSKGYLLSPTSDYSKSASGSVRASSNFEETKDDSPAELDLMDQDIMRLISAVSKSNMSDLLSIMTKAVDNRMSSSFVVHAITALRSMPSQNASRFILDIFENLENLMPHLVHQLPSMKNITTLFAFNILPVLDQRRDYATAVRIINIFAKEMDTFIETKCFTHNEWLSTTQLRYVFIFKILVRANKLRDALRLLKSPNLGVETFAANTDRHFSYKQRLLNEFISTSLQKELQVARETILYLMLNMDALKNSINLVKFLNQLLVNLLNSYLACQSELLGLIDNISNGWYKHLKHSIMRAILARTFYDLPERKLMEFFNLCVEIGIYQIHEGYDNSIGIPKNLLSEEIQFILHVHFHKICKSNFPLHSIVITLVDPIEMDEYTNLLSIFTNSLANDTEMITRIVNVFPKFDHFHTPDKVSISQGLITIPYEYLQVFLKPYRTGLPSITKFR